MICHGPTLTYMGRKHGNSPRTLGPLRLVVDHFSDRGLEYEKLECGHTILRKSDMFGPTYAVRRRCYLCRIEETSVHGTTATA